MTIDTKREANPLQFLEWWRAMKVGSNKAFRPMKRDDVVLYQALSDPPLAVMVKDLDATAALIEAFVASQAAKKDLLPPAGRDESSSQVPAILLPPQGK